MATGRVAVPDATQPGGRPWRIATAVLALLVAVVSLLPPRGTPGVEIADLGEVLATVGHAVAYAVLAASAVLAQRDPRTLLTWTVVVAYGALLEIAQGALGLRSFQLTDIAANALGALVGVLVAGAWRRRARVS